MVHIPKAYNYDFWVKTPSDDVELTCLMPNGVIIPLEVNRNTTFGEIKEVRFFLFILIIKLHLI